MFIRTVFFLILAQPFGSIPPNGGAAAEPNTKTPAIIDAKTFFNIFPLPYSKYSASLLQHIYKNSARQMIDKKTDRIKKYAPIFL